MSPTWIAVRAHARLLGYAFVRGPGPALVVSGLFCVVAFGPNGLDPRDVARMTAPWTAGRLVALAAVVVALRSGVRVLLSPPGSAYARASIVPLVVQRLLVAAFVVAAVSPLPLVLLAGRAPLDALVVAAASTGACVGAGPRSVALALAVGLLPGPALPLAIVVAAGALAHAHAVAGVEPRIRRRRGWIPPWPVGLVATLARVALRAGPATSLSASAPLLGLWLVRAADPEDRGARAVSLAAAVAAIGATPLARVVGRGGRAIEPLARTAGRPRRAAWLAAVVVLATPSLAFAAGAHAVAASGPASAVGAAVVAILVVVEARLAAARKDAPLLLPLAALAVVACATALAMRGVGGLAVLVALGAGALASSPPEVVRGRDR